MLGVGSIFLWGTGVEDGMRNNSERCLKWGGGGVDHYPYLTRVFFGTISHGGGHDAPIITLLLLLQ